MTYKNCCKCFKVFKTQTKITKTKRRVTNWIINIFIENGFNINKTSVICKSCYNLLLKAKENKAVLDEIMLCFKFKAMELNKTFQNTSFISDILANKSDNEIKILTS